MEKQLHLAEKRTHVDYGWLRSAHSFDFGGHTTPHGHGFGALWVLNDDALEGEAGFEQGYGWAFCLIIIATQAARPCLGRSDAARPVARS